MLASGNVPFVTHEQVTLLLDNGDKGAALLGIRRDEPVHSAGPPHVDAHSIGRAMRSRWPVSLSRWHVADESVTDDRPRLPPARPERPARARRAGLGAAVLLT